MEQPSRGNRYGSLFVDFISIVLITILIMNSSSYMVRFIGVFIPVVYFPLLHGLFSQSIGDLVFKLKIVDQQGNKIGFKLAMNRFVCVLKYSVFASFLTNLLFLFLMLFSGTIRDIREVSFNYEEDSNTYLVKAG